MIYLNNNTSQQECWIPRQDVLSGHSGSKIELEGKTVVISADTTNVYPSSGYDGMSAVTVDATEYAQQNYDGGFEDGYQDGFMSGSSEGFESGYTSGHTDGVNEEKAKMSAVTFTANTAVTLSDGSYSAVTVDVPQTGYTQQDLDNAFASGETVGENTIIATFSSTTATTNGQYGSTAHPLSAITVNVPTGSTAVLGEGSFSANGTYSASTDNLDGYSAITINVETAAKTISVTGDTWYELDHVFSIGEKIDITNVTFDVSASTGWRYQQLIAGGSGDWFRVGGRDGNDLYVAYNGEYNDFINTSLNNDHILITNDALYINGNQVGTFGPYMSQIGYSNMCLFADNSMGSDCVEDQTATVGTITIYDEYDNIVAQYIPELYNGYACFYNPISDTYIYPMGTGIPIYNGQIPFSSITITANTAITVSDVAYTGITVNVPQTGSSVKYLEYIETNGTQIGWDTGYNIGTDIDAKIYLDFMPISGNGYGDVWFAYYGDCAEKVLFRRRGNNSPIGFMFGNNRTYIDTSTYSVVNGNRYLISLDKNGITDENTGTLLVAASSSSINSTKNLYLNCEGLGGNNQINRCIRARYYSFRVENGNGNTALDMRPCLDGNDVPCFYDEVSKQYIYHSGSGTPISGPVLPSPDYQSGYTSGFTDGYNSGYTSGYTDGQDSIISTFTAMTATTNGVYGSSANPLSSITVNVPQTGSSLPLSSITITGNTAITVNDKAYTGITVNVPQGSYTIDDLARRNYNIADPTINVSVKPHSFQDAGLTGQLTLTNAVSNVYTFAFYGNPITGITWPTSTIWVNGPYCFSECGLQGKLVIPANVRFSLVDTTFSFYNCTGITSIEFYANSGNPVVPKECFVSCENITDVDLYDVSTVKQEAFYGCSALTLINVHSTVAPVIEDYTCFSGISSSGTVHYPSGADYSSWQSDSTLSGWTFIGDL